MFSSMGKKNLKATIRFVMSACLYVRPSVRMEQFGSNWMDIYETEHLCMFKKKIYR